MSSEDPRPRPASLLGVETSPRSARAVIRAARWYHGWRVYDQAESRTARVPAGGSGALNRSFPDGRRLAPRLGLQGMRLPTRRNGCNDFPRKYAASTPPVAA